MLPYNLYHEYKNLSSLISSHAGLLESYSCFDHPKYLPKGSFDECFNPHISTAVQECLSLPREKWMNKLDEDIPELDILFAYADCISVLYDIETPPVLPEELEEQLRYFQLEDSVLSRISSEDGNADLIFTDVLCYSPRGWNPPVSVSLHITLTEALVITVPHTPSFTGFFGAEKQLDGQYILAIYGDGGELRISFNGISIENEINNSK